MSIVTGPITHDGVLIDVLVGVSARPFPSLS